VPAKPLIIGDKEKDLQRIESEAYREAQTIQGVADAKATEIYAAAYNQSEISRDLYDFVKTLETYNRVIDSSTTLALTTESELHQLLNGAYSRPRLPLIPDEACHPFHAKAATDSTAKLPPWQAA